MNFSVGSLTLPVVVVIVHQIDIIYFNAIRLWVQNSCMHHQISSGQTKVIDVIEEKENAGLQMADSKAFHVTG